MVKHTRTIRRQQPMNRLSVFGNFVGFFFKGLNSILTNQRLASHLIHFLIICQSKKCRVRNAVFNNEQKHDTFLKKWSTVQNLLPK